MDEIWSKIDGYNGRYEVSSFGRVRSIFHINGHGNLTLYDKPHYLKPQITHDGYLKVTLSNRGRLKKFLIHRLVAFAFIPNVHNYPEINHKDENSKNNHVNNLEWCTAKYNSNYGTLPLRISIQQTNHPKKSKPVIQYGRDGSFIAMYPSIKEAMRRTGTSDVCISRCCKGRIRTSNGFVWRYKNKTK